MVPWRECRRRAARWTTRTLTSRAFQTQPRPHCSSRTRGALHCRVGLRHSGNESAHCRQRRASIELPPPPDPMTRRRRGTAQAARRAPAPVLSPARLASVNRVESVPSRPSQAPQRCERPPAGRHDARHLRTRARAGRRLSSTPAELQSNNRHPESTGSRS